MLDIIRKKASAWLTKIIFAIIIIVFVFFFGYSRMSSRYKSGGSVVAKVNGTTISRGEYQLAYDNTYKMYQNIFKNETGELPEGIQKSVANSTMNQLVQQQVVKNFGEKLGVAPTELEVAEAIKSSPVIRDESGNFDELGYKKRFLPYFSQKYNMDYEYLVAGDVLLNNVQDIFKSAEKAPFAKDDYNRTNTKWTFEVTEFDSEENAKAGREGKVKKVGPINVAERTQLFPSAEMGFWEKVFTFNSNSPALKEPLLAGDKWCRVKIVKIDLPTSAQWEKDKESFIKAQAAANQREFFQSWVSGLAKKADIKTFVE